MQPGDIEKRDAFQNATPRSCRNLPPCRVTAESAERLKEPDPSVDGRASADADDEVADSRVEQVSQLLADPEGRGPQRVTPGFRYPFQSGGFRQFEECASGGEQRVMRHDRFSERPADATLFQTPAGGACGRLDRPLSTVRERQLNDRIPWRNFPDPFGEIRRYLRRPETVLEGVGGENPLHNPLSFCSVSEAAGM